MNPLFLILTNLIAFSCSVKNPENFDLENIQEKNPEISAIQNEVLKIKPTSENQSLTVWEGNDFLTAWLLKESGNKPAGDHLMKMMQSKNPSSKVVQWCNAVYSGNLEQTGIIEKEVEPNDRTFQIMRRIKNELFNLKY
jgi:hypothetical protein